MNLAPATLRKAKNRVKGACTETFRCLRMELLESWNYLCIFPDHNAMLAFERTGKNIKSTESFPTAVDKHGRVAARGFAECEPFISTDPNMGVPGQSLPAPLALLTTTGTSWE